MLWQVALAASPFNRVPQCRMIGAESETITQGLAPASNAWKRTASLGNVLKTHGPGVYTVVLWGVLGGDHKVISEYSVFHDIPRPSGYD